MDLQLKDKVAVITGGSVGIGLAVAQGLAVVLADHWPGWRGSGYFQDHCLAVGRLRLCADGYTAYSGGAVNQCLGGLPTTVAAGAN